jgi:VWFA-related protein
MTVLRVALSAALLGQAAVPQVQETAKPELTVRAEEYLLGPVTLRATLTPVDTPFLRADFFVDGAAKCRVERLPLECAFDAGPEAVVRRIRVAVTLEDGTRLAGGFESRSLALEEKASVRNVFVPVMVWDRRGTFMSGLTRDSFQVLEDGVVQPIQFFMSENIPLELTLALDVSESMAGILGSVKAAAKELVARLKSTDRVHLLAFNQRVFTLARPDADLEERTRAIDRLTSQGGTALYDAMVRGMALLGQQMSRRAMIVFTDGRDENSLSTIEGIEERLLRSDVTLYVITYGRGSEIEGLRRRVDRLAESTGGQGFAVRDVRELSGLFTRILDELSEHYLLTYTSSRPQLDGSMRKIQVRLVGQKERYEIKARSGYRASAGAP